MKKLIVTRADEKIKEMCEITHPILKEYADKCDADFRIISDNKGLHPHYRIMQLYDLFEEYDRILCLDSDMLILNTCPDIFDIVPVDFVGSVFEDKGSRQVDRRNRIEKIQLEREDVGWNSGYINTGCAIFSKEHQKLFNPINLYFDFGYDDVLLGYRINKCGFITYELPWNFNAMSMFFEDETNDRADAYILHYAGRGFFPHIDRLEQIKQDYLIFKKYGLL